MTYVRYKKHPYRYKEGRSLSFNLGVSNHPVSRLGGLSSVGVYLYEDIYYRQWIKTQ
jgi:hypothetical protein